MSKSLFTQGPVRGSEAFEQAWEVYPDRHVAENKRDALRQWLARVREGVGELAMIDGSRRYRDYCLRSRIFGTEYVMQPRRFFGSSRPFELPWIINGGKVAAQEARSQATITNLRAQEQAAMGREEAKILIAKLRSKFEGKAL